MWTLLIAFAISAPGASPKLDLPPVGTDLVPGPPRLPEGLPAPEESPGGTWLPSPLDDAVSRMLGYCTVGYPSVVRLAITKTREAGAASCADRIDIAVAQAQLEAAPPAPSIWRPWVVATATSAAFIAGIIVGARAVR